MRRFEFFYPNYILKSERKRHSYVNGNLFDMNMEQKKGKNVYIFGVISSILILY